MKKLFFILAVIFVVCSIDCKSITKSAIINKNNKFKVTNDGGKTWQYVNGNVSLENSKSTNNSATFIKNYAKYTQDGGKTWEILRNYDNFDVLKISGLEIFPNPVINNSINIRLFDLALNDDVYISIYDQSGKLFYETIGYIESLNSNTISFDISDLPTGYYILLLTNNKIYFVKQFQKL